MRTAHWLEKDTWPWYVPSHHKAINAVNIIPSVRKLFKKKKKKTSRIPWTVWIEDDHGIGGQLIVLKIYSSTIEGRYWNQPSPRRTVWQKLNHRPSVMARHYINEQRSSALLEDHSVHLIRRVGIMNPVMIRPSKQSQRLRREILYIPIDKARKEGTQLYSSKSLHSYYSLPNC